MHLRFLWFYGLFGVLVVAWLYGFFSLFTAATIAAKSGDPFAVQRLLGHADLKMATTYVQNISEQTDRVINNTRKLTIQGNS